MAGQDIHDESQFIDDDLFTVHEIKVDPRQEPLRIDKFLCLRLEASRNKIQNAALAGNIIVNGKTVKSNYKVKPNDALLLLIPKSDRTYHLMAEDIPLNIVHEDADVIVLIKNPGMVVHPGTGNPSGTLVNALMHHVENLPVKDDETRAGLVHRLDKDTSGLMVVAKNELCMSLLAKQFFDRTIKRSYLAMVWGDFEEESGTVEINLGRDLRHRKLMAAFPDADYGKVARTDYEIVERFGYVTLIRCKLHTGRTHQIRVHMKHIGHPVFNDINYGGDRIVKGTIYTKYKQFVDNCFKVMTTQALHAESLGFLHPNGQEMFFKAELPEPFELLVDKWRKYTSGRDLQYQ